MALSYIGPYDDSIHEFLLSPDDGEVVTDLLRLAEKVPLFLWPGQYPHVSGQGGISLSECLNLYDGVGSVWKLPAFNPTWQGDCQSYLSDGISLLYGPGRFAPLRVPTPPFSGGNGGPSGGGGASGNWYNPVLLSNGLVGAVPLQTYLSDVIVPVSVYRYHTTGAYPHTAYLSHVLVSALGFYPAPVPDEFNGHTHDLRVFACPLCGQQGGQSYQYIMSGGGEYRRHLVDDRADINGIWALPLPLECYRGTVIHTETDYTHRREDYINVTVYPPFYVWPVRKIKRPWIPWKIPPLLIDELKGKGLEVTSGGVLLSIADKILTIEGAGLRLNRG